MLTLRRLPGESVTLHVYDEDYTDFCHATITVTVVAVHGSEVTLAFQAPKSVAILRDDAKEKEKKT